MAEELSDRLNDATARLLRRPVSPDDRFGIAVSGGADSMALLSLADGCWPGQVEAASVDHGLREAAAGEVRMVANWCAGLGIAHAILRPREAISGNLQSQARAVRYALLEGWRAERELDWLLTAHHHDDQVETLLLRLNRGAGVGGLTAIRGRRGHILRPLLCFRRAELRQYCTSGAIPFTDDPSNEDDRFDRARLRKMLAGTDLIEAEGLARSLDALGDAATALEWMTERLEGELVRREGEALVLDPSGLPGEMQRRLLARMIARINPDAEPPRGPAVDQALVQLFDAKTVALADCLVSGGDRWTVRRAPPRRNGL